MKFDVENFASDLREVFEKHDVKEIKMMDWDSFMGFKDGEFNFNDNTIIMNKPNWYVQQMKGKGEMKFNIGDK